MAQPVVGALEQQLARPWLSSATHDIARDPSLDDLLDDPIMLLLWHGDGLEPSQLVRRSRTCWHRSDAAGQRGAA